MTSTVSRTTPPAGVPYALLLTILQSQFGATANDIEALQLHRIAQVVNFETGAVATGTTIMPVDDTIPQNGEGDQYMSLAITPQNAASTLLIDVVWIGSFSLAGDVVAALFQDAGANALAVGDQYQATGTGRVIIAFRHKMTAGSTTSTTFKVRAGGGAAGTTTFNGGNGTRLFGGVMASSITVTEVTP